MNHILTNEIRGSIRMKLKSNLSAEQHERHHRSHFPSKVLLRDSIARDSVIIKSSDNFLCYSQSLSKLNQKKKSKSIFGTLKNITLLAKSEKCLFELFKKESLFLDLSIVESN